MRSLSDSNQADIIVAFNSTSLYLDDLLNIDNPYFDRFVSQIYPFELQLNKANRSETEAPFLDLHLSISNGFVSSKIYDKRDDFDFDILGCGYSTSAFLWKVQVGKDQEKAQSEKDSHYKNRGGKKQTNNQVLIP